MLATGDGLHHACRDAEDLERARTALAPVDDEAEPMLRGAVRTYIRRRVLRRGWLWLAAAGLLLASLAAGWTGGAPFIAGLAVAALAFLALFVAALWRAHLANTLGRFRAMDPPTAEAVFGPDGMTVSSNLGSSTMPWSSFVEVWELEDAWLLFPAPNHFVTLPASALSPEVRVFLRSRLPPATA